MSRMDRLDGLLVNRSEFRNRGAHSREASREPRVSLNEHPNRGRTYGSTIGRGKSSSSTTGSHRSRIPTNIRAGSIGIRPTSNQRPTREAPASGRGESANCNPLNQGRAHSCDSDRREVLEPQTSDMDDQSRYSRDATAIPEQFLGDFSHKVVQDP